MSSSELIWKVWLPFDREVARRARGEAYVKYISEKFGATHPIMIVDECGHNNRCVFTTDHVLPVIFPK